jgi:ribonuclease G
MYKEILINVEPQEKRVAVLEDGILEEFYVERTSIKQIVGNIYKGKVVSVVPGIRAAFVDIGLDKNGFLYLQDLVKPLYSYEDEEDLICQDIETPEYKNTKLNIKEFIKKEQDVLVQVVREALGKKGARLTTHIALPGRYLVLVPEDKNLGISRKIEDIQERKRLRSIFAEINLPKDVGVVVRTAGSGKQKKEFARESKYLLSLWQRIKRNAVKRPAPSLIYEEQDLVLRIVRDSFTEGVNKLIVDSKEEYGKIMHFLRLFSPNLRNKVKLYRGEQPLFEIRDIENQIEKIYNRKVHLKCGGYIVIEPTEALVVVDVNSGRFTGSVESNKKVLGETAFLVNREAAEEIARQIRLRDLGGIIVIDFIDMESIRQRKEVLSVLERALKRDRAKINILPVSTLGLVEMTRQKMRRGIESVSYETCFYCGGRGQVKSATTMSIFAFRKIKKFLKRTKQRQINLIVHPNVANHILGDKKLLNDLENKFRVKVTITANPDFHIEDIKIK